MERILQIIEVQTDDELEHIRTLGFRDIAPYEYFDVDDMVYLELPL